MEVDVTQGEAARLGMVGKAHVIEVHGPVSNFHDRICWVGKVGLLEQNLADAACALLRHGDHDEDHREHVEAHQHGEAIGDEGAHVAHLHGGARSGDDALGGEVDHGGVDGVHGKRHDGLVPGKDTLSAPEVLEDLARRTVELLLLVLLAHEALHHANAGDVLLNALVQAVVLLEDAPKDRHDRAGDGDQGKAQQEAHHHIERRHRATGNEGHRGSKHDHERAANGRADDLHVGHLHVLRVGRQACDQRVGAEAVNVGEAERLDGSEHVVTKVARKTR